MKFNQIQYEDRFYLPEWISERVTAIQKNGFPIFRTGYWSELREINNNINRSIKSKYPIIYLPLNFKYNYNNDTPFFTVPFEIYIITKSERDYDFDTRLDSIIKTILEPIYTDFLTEIKYDKWVKNENNTIISHEKKYISYDKGQAENQNQLNEVVEAIYLIFNLEFNNLENL